MTKVTKGAVVKCQPNGNMEYEFIGTVTKCYENAVLVMIDEFDPRDRMNARELLYRVIISRSAMMILTPGEELAPAVADAG